MKQYLPLLVFTILLIGCDAKIDLTETPEKSKNIESSKNESICESTQFTYVLSATENLDSNTYVLTITSKKDSNSFEKKLSCRPKLSKISFCNDFYTVVSFSCGGPCYSEIYVSTNPKQAIKQFANSQRIENKPNLIAHIKNQAFDTLWISNLNNNQEFSVPIPELHWTSYGKMDRLAFVNQNLQLEFLDSNGVLVRKQVAFGLN